MTELRYERTFEVRVDPAAAWAAFTEQPDGHWWLPGFESAGTPVDVEPGQRLHVVKDQEPCRGTEIVVTVESIESGSRITVVQTGFPAHFESILEVLWLGGDRIVADLAAAMELGVGGLRHLVAFADAGASFETTAAGQVVRSVSDGGLADRAGLRPGDLLVAVGAAPIVTLAEQQAAFGALPAGTAVDLTVLRDQQLLTLSDCR
jgi:hypothetical protein